MGFLTVITNLTKMFLLSLLGSLVVKLKVMPGQTSKPISSLMLKVCLPPCLFPWSGLSIPCSLPAA